MQRKIKSASSRKPGTYTGRQKPSSKVFPQGAKKAYVSQSARFKNPEPIVVSLKDSCRVTHREFLQDVASSTAFTATSYTLNPGMAQAFPWLNQIARRYETYRFESLRFCYAPRCSTATAGTVILAIDYDPQDPAPTDKSSVLAYHGCVASSPWDECINSSDKPTLIRRSNLFVRGANVANTDIKTYDLGNLYLCTSGFAGDGTPCGELYVEYTIVLNTPQISSDAIVGAKLVASSGLAAGSLFGTGTTVSGGLSVTVTSASTLTFNEPFEGVAVCRYVGTGVTTAADSCTGTATNTIITAASSAFIINGSTTDGVMVLRIKALRGQTIVPVRGTASTITSVTWYFGNYDYDL